MGLATPVAPNTWQDNQMDRLSDFDQDFIDLCLQALDQPWSNAKQLVDNLRGRLTHVTMHPEDARDMLRQWAREIAKHKLHDQPDQVTAATEEASATLTGKWLFPAERWWYT